VTEHEFLRCNLQRAPTTEMWWPLELSVSKYRIHITCSNKIIVTIVTRVIKGTKVTTVGLRALWIIDMPKFYPFKVMAILHEVRKKALCGNKVCPHRLSASCYQWSHRLPDLHEIWHRYSLQKPVNQICFSWKSSHWQTYIASGRKTIFDSYFYIS